MKNYRLIDTHCHLYLEEFKDDISQYLERAEDEGVNRIYLPALDKSHFDALVSLADRYPTKCFAMAGIHPCYVKENFREELSFLEDALSKRRFSAIGEIGLDYYWDRSFDEQQMTCFIEQIALAKAQRLPIVIHSRSSMTETVKVLKSQRDPLLRGIFHCFSGTYEDAMDIIDCGLLLGIGGVITYKNSGLAQVVARLPMDSIVLETDAPYLTPVPFRGKRNESSYLKYVVEKIAEVKGMTVEEVAASTTRNALAVFGD